MEELDMCLGFHREVRFQLGTLCQEGNVTVQYVNLLPFFRHERDAAPDGEPADEVQPPIVASTVIRASFVFCAKDSISIGNGLSDYFLLLLFLDLPGLTREAAPLAAEPTTLPAIPPAIAVMPITVLPAAEPAPELTPPESARKPLRAQSG